MYAICCVIHHRGDLVPTEISPRDVLQIAITADKYDLTVALTFARAQWLQNKDINDPKKLVCLMSAALLFDDESMFIDHGQALILRHAGSYMGLLYDEALRQTLPAGLPRKLNRTTFRETFEFTNLLQTYWKKEETA